MSMPRSGAGAEAESQTYASPWFLYDDLLFLTDVIQPREYVLVSLFVVPYRFSFGAFNDGFYFIMQHNFNFNFL